MSCQPLAHLQVGQESPPTQKLGNVLAMLVTMGCRQPKRSGDKSG